MAAQEEAREVVAEVWEHAPMAVFNHVGQCVTDLERSRRFYVEVLGFEVWREITVPDEPSDRLLRLKPPIDMTACYLRVDGFVLELLHYGGEGAAPLPYRERVMNEPGLTHVSVSVDDIDETCRLAVAHGGSVLDDTNIDGAVMIRDPEGQLVELLPDGLRRARGERVTHPTSPFGVPGWRSTRTDGAKRVKGATRRASAARCVGSCSCCCAGTRRRRPSVPAPCSAPGWRDSAR